LDTSINGLFRRAERFDWLQLLIFSCREPVIA